jgi:L-ascorbate metabolism protein UlaG (beta-lactamase superfamily)
VILLNLKSEITIQKSQIINERMKKTLLLIVITAMLIPVYAQLQKDIFKTSGGELAISFIGHGTLMMEYNGKVIHIDPVSQFADYSKLPKADLVLITHQHGDHLDPSAIEKISKPGMQVALAKVCLSKYPKGIVLNNGESGIFDGIRVEAVPAYNIKNERGPGQPFHPKGEGNGYILNFDDLTVYVAGDSENTPEMKNLKNIDIAFLPMNLPYTMTPEMVADAARSFKPKILYPYHFGDTNTDQLVQLLKGEPVEVRIRNLK